MIFTRTSSISTNLSNEEVKSRLVGKQVKIHNLDFEIFEKENVLKIIPHAEQEEGVKTLPITRVIIKSNGTSTNVKLKSKMRRIDSGGPYLIVGFSFFLIAIGIGFYFLGGADFSSYSYLLVGIGAVINFLMWLRLNSGYFDYIRKIKKYVQDTLK